MNYKVLYVSGTSEIGGGERSLQLLLKYLDKSTFDPVVACPVCGPLGSELSRMGIEVHPLSRPLLLKSQPWMLPSLVRQLVSVIRKRDISLIHSNGEGSNPYCLIAGRLTKTPVVCHVRNIIPFRKFLGFLVFLPKLLIANSKATAANLRCFGMGNGKIVQIYNAVDLEEFQPERANVDRIRQEFGLNGSHLLLGAIGRMVPYKGFADFLKAIPQVRLMFDNFKVLIVGDASLGDARYFKELRHLPSELGISDKVIFTGFRSDVRDIIAALDILIVPSWAEPFGRTVIEGMAMEIPVIGTWAGGIPEIIEDGKTGFLVGPREPDSIAERIIWLLRHPCEAKCMGERGRKRVEQFFGGEGHATAVEKIYWQLLDEKNGGCL